MFTYRCVEPVNPLSPTLGDTICRRRIHEKRDLALLGRHGGRPGDGTGKTAAEHCHLILGDQFFHKGAPSAYLPLGIFNNEMELHSAYPARPVYFLGSH